MRNGFFTALFALGHVMVYLARLHSAECDRGRIGNALLIRAVHAPIRATYCAGYGLAVMLYG